MLKHGCYDTQDMTYTIMVRAKICALVLKHWFSRGCVRSAKQRASPDESFVMDKVSGSVTTAPMINITHAVRQMESLQHHQAFALPGMLPKGSNILAAIQLGVPEMD